MPEREQMVVIATTDEVELAKKLTDGSPILITGIGALNVINALKDIPKDTPILNIGYAGSNKIAVGTVVDVGKVKMYHPNVEFSNPEFNLGEGVTCFTSNDFVTETKVEEPCVFDMELAYIPALGFYNVKAVKVVSDNLNLHQYENTIAKENPNV